MLRLQKKSKYLDRLSESDRKRTIAEINASGTVIDMIKEELDDKINNFQSQMLSEKIINDPLMLTGYARVLKEFKTFRTLFDKTTEE